MNPGDKLVSLVERHHKCPVCGNDCTFELFMRNGSDIFSERWQLSSVEDREKYRRLEFWHQSRWHDHGRSHNMANIELPDLPENYNVEVFSVWCMRSKSVIQYLPEHWNMQFSGDLELTTRIARFGKQCVEESGANILWNGKKCDLVNPTCTDAELVRFARKMSLIQ